MSGDANRSASQVTAPKRLHVNVDSCCSMIRTHILSLLLPLLILNIKSQQAYPAMTFTLSSKAFSNGSPIPSIYSRCDGEDISPPLEWVGAPEGTNSFALIVDDPDAPNPAQPKMTWVHWVLYNIPPTTTSLAEGVSVSSLPKGTLEAINDWKKPGYGGPSPPIGTHRYFFKLYALDTVLPDLGGLADKASVLKAMKGHVMGETELIGTYKKGGNKDS